MLRDQDDPRIDQNEVHCARDVMGLWGCKDSFPRRGILQFLWEANEAVRRIGEARDRELEARAKLEKEKEDKEKRKKKQRKKKQEKQNRN